MAEVFTDIAVVEIDARQVRTVKSISIETRDTKTPVKTMNAERRALGVTRGVPDFSGKFSAVIQPVDPEIDWFGWMLRKEARLVVWDLNGDGDRRSLVDVYINSVSEKHDEGGESMYDIDFVALDRKED